VGTSGANDQGSCGPGTPARAKRDAGRRRRVWVRPFLVGLLTALALAPWLARPRALAQALTVTREPGAEECPDADALEAQVVTLRNGQRLALDAAYHVHFAGTAEQRRATLSSASPAQAERVRVLDARGPSCRGLAQATALTLALLLDEQAQLAAEPARKKPPLRRSEPEPGRELQRDPAGAREPALPERALSLTLGGGVLLGVTRTLAPLWLAEVGFSQRRFRVDLGALGVPVQRLDFAPGSLREWLVAGSLRGCYLPYRAPRLSIGTCTGAFLGLIDVRTRGYTRNARRKEMWAAIPIELFFGYQRGPFALQVAAQALIPLRRPDFSIDGLGTAYASWPVAASLALRVLGLWHGAFRPAQKM
jgi:hypothetical protein